MELFAKDGKLRSALASAERRVAAFASTVAKIGAGAVGVGAGIIGGIGALFTAKIGQVNDLGKLADKLGVNVGELGAFTYAAESTGVSLQELEGHFENFVERVSEAALGGGEAADTFRRLGIDARALKLMPLTEQLKTVADAMGGVTNETERLGMLSKFGGDQFQKLNKFFKLGSGGINQLMDEGRRVGAAPGDAEKKQAEQIQLAWFKASTAVKSAFLSIGGALLPQAKTIDTIATSIVNVAVGARDWMQANKGLVMTLLLVGGGITLVGVALIALGLTATVVMTSITGLFSIATLAVSAFNVALAITEFLLTPVGLAVVGVTVAVVALTAIVAGLGYWFFTATDSGKEMWSALSWYFGDMLATFQKAWGGIGAAIAKGDLKLAGQIALAALNVEWQKGLAVLQIAWIDFKGMLVDVWEGAITEIQTMGRGLVNWLAQLLTTILGKLGDMIGVDLLGAPANLINDAIQSQTDKAIDRINAEAEAAKKVRDSLLDGERAGAMTEVEKAQAELARLVAQAEKVKEEVKKEGEQQRRMAPTFSGSRGLFSAADFRQAFARPAETVPKLQLQAQQEANKKLDDVVNVLGDIKDGLPRFT